MSKTMKAPAVLLDRKALAKAIRDRDVQALMRVLGEPVETDLDRMPADTPATLTVKPAARTALQFLAKAIDKLPLPSERRQLSPSERLTFLKLMDDVKAARTAVSDVEVAIRESFHRHLDVELELRDGEADVDDKGRYIAPGEIRAAGHDRKAVRQVSELQPFMDAEAVESLYRDGTITRGQWLAVTRKVEARAIDETGLLDAVAKDPSLGAKLSEAITRGERQVSIYMRDDRIVA
jgi:hypothetical protein